MNVRFATLDDIPELIRLRFDFFNEEPELQLAMAQSGDISRQLSRYFETHLGKDFFAALANDGGRTASVSFLVIQERPANVRFPTGRTGEILNVFTYPEFRLKGLASATLRTLIDKAQAEQLSFVELSATPSGKYVYEKLGFLARVSGYCTEMILNLI